MRDDRYEMGLSPEEEQALTAALDNEKFNEQTDKLSALKFIIEATEMNHGNVYHTFRNFARKEAFNEVLRLAGLERCIARHNAELEACHFCR